MPPTATITDKRVTGNSTAYSCAKMNPDESYYFDSTEICSFFKHSVDTLGVKLIYRILSGIHAVYTDDWP